MGSLKNVMMIAVLAAVGYGVYVSLSRNNMDSGNLGSFDTGSLTPRKTEAASTKTPLPLSSSTAQSPALAAGSGGPSAAPAMPTPPLDAGAGRRRPFRPTARPRCDGLNARHVRRLRCDSRPAAAVRRHRIDDGNRVAARRLVPCRRYPPGRAPRNFRHRPLTDQNAQHNKGRRRPAV